MSRIDLRGQALDLVTLRRACCPGPSSTSRPRSRRSARSASGSARAVPRRCAISARGSTASGRIELRVPAAALAGGARAGSTRVVRAALEESIRRARLVHRDQRRHDTVTQVVPGGSVTERWVPVSRVGLYVPGGLAVYPSSVVMNVVPAQEAGVGSLAVACPPQRDNPTRVRRAAQPDGPRGLRAARCRRGLRRRWRAGDRDVRLRRARDRRARTLANRSVPRSIWSPDPATSTSPRPSGCSRA